MALVVLAFFEVEVADIEGEGGGFRAERAGGEFGEGVGAPAFGHEGLDFDEEAAFGGADGGFDAGFDAVAAVEGFQEGGVFPVLFGEGEGVGGPGRGGDQGEEDEEECA